ncbi:MAG: hypothetical protein IT432_04125 [Phycisphaerales bacterium]|nr:hypothetical protein [Phycisphaerales bacterium]
MSQTTVPSRALRIVTPETRASEKHPCQSKGTPDPDTGRLGPSVNGEPVGSGRPPGSSGSSRKPDDHHPRVTLLSGFGMPVIRLGVDPLEIGRDFPPVSNANIIDKANSVVLIIRNGKLQQVPLHALQGPGVKKAIRDLGLRYGDPDRIAEVVFGYPNRWHGCTGTWVSTVLSMPDGVGVAQQIGRKLAHWKWIMQTIIDAACPGATMVVSQGSINHGTYAIRSSEFRTGIRNAFRTACWA